MFTPEKIEEWLQEVSERPNSAAIIIQFIANRLRDLDEWNEKLRAENLALRSGARVDEYERQIAHLEYQLELLKRQVSGEVDLDALVEIAPKPETGSRDLLVYGPQGRVLRLQLDTDQLEDGRSLWDLGGIQAMEGEPPRILAVPSTEELMLIFTSGRVTNIPASGIPLQEGTDTVVPWEHISIPVELNVGETLACIAPVSKMALSDFYLQTSRRGYMKKIRKALAPTITENKYIGTGVKVPADQTLTLTMGHENEYYVLVSYEGYIQYIPEGMLPYAIVEAMRLGKADHLVATFPASMDVSVIVMTQIGKIIHRTADSLELASDLQRKGRMLYTTARRQAGVRVVGAAAVEQDGWALALHQDGKITLHNISELIGRGSIPVEGELLDFATFSPPLNGMS